MEHPNAEPPVPPLFRAAVDRALAEDEVPDTPEIARHLTRHVLVEFLHVDRLFRMRNAQGRPLQDLPEIVSQSSSREGPEHRHETDEYIGNFALFMAGLLPEAVERRRPFVPEPMIGQVGRILVRFKNPLSYYAAEGRNAFERAGETARVVEPEAEHVLHRLASEFDGYVRVLGAIRRRLWSVNEVRKLEQSM